MSMEWWPSQDKYGGTGMTQGWKNDRKRRKGKDPFLVVLFIFLVAVAAGIFLA